MNILYINACVRKESRTLVIARDIINKMKMSFVEINLEKEKLKPLTEKRLSMIDCTELTKEITSLERNTTSGKIDHPPQTSRKVDGKTIKSVGKDLADSLCGAVYNASISVDMNALDYMEGITLTDDSSILKTSQTTADSYFGLSVDYNGVVSLNNNTQPLTKEEQFNQAIQEGINDTRNILNSIKKANPETKLSDKQLQDLYNNFTNGDFLIM